MAVKITSGVRQITLGRCVFLFLASTALSYIAARVLVAVGVPSDLSIIGVPTTGWLGPLLGAAIFTWAFRAFSEPAVKEGAA
jgi:hypothetical protein